jgi:hypothetical protein
MQRPQGMTDSDWQGVLNRIANRDARVKSGVEYFTKQGITRDQLQKLAEQNPPSGANRRHGGELLKHSREFGSKQPLSETTLLEILKQMGLK